MKLKELTFLKPTLFRDVEIHVVKFLRIAGIISLNNLAAISLVREMEIVVAITQIAKC